MDSASDGPNSRCPQGHASSSSSGGESISRFFRLLVAVLTPCCGHIIPIFKAGKFIYLFALSSYWLLCVCVRSPSASPLIQRLRPLGQATLFLGFPRKRIAVIACRAHLDKSEQSPHPKILNVVTSAKTPFFPYMVTLSHSQDQDVDIIRSVGLGQQTLLGLASKP